MVKQLKKVYLFLQRSTYHISSTFILKNEMFRPLIVSWPSFGISYAVSTIKVKYHTVHTSSCTVLLFLFNFSQNGNVSIVVELQNIKYHKNPLVKTQ